MEQSSEHSIPTNFSTIGSLSSGQIVGNNAWGVHSGTNPYHASSNVSLFSSSLPVLRHQKLNFAGAEHGVLSVEDTSAKLTKIVDDMEGKDALEDLDLGGLGILLPDDEDDLLAGIMADFDTSGLTGQVEELDEYDLFGSGGGMELDSDPMDMLSVGMAKASIGDGYTVSGIVHYAVPNGVGTVAGEHPYGEHPSRTLFVRNINSNVEDSELRSLFGQYGDIRTLYTACKHRGFVMISYYDIRDARTAMRALQNKPLRRRKLDIHFSIPKDNPSDKDINQGTLVVFNLDPSVSNDDLRQIFGAYGEVKEIRETPHKRHHKFIEFYDVRGAEAALRSLNRSDIAGKRIKLEPSRPGGARRNLMQQLSQELEQDDTRIYRHQVGSPIGNSPPGTWPHFSSPSGNDLFQPHTKSPTTGPISPMAGNYSHGLASVIPPLISSSVKIAPIGKDHGKVNRVDQVVPNGNFTSGAGFQLSCSVPEHGSGMTSNLSSSLGSMSSFGPSSIASAIGTLSGPQFLWGSPNPYTEKSQSSAWPSSSIGNSFTSNGQRPGEGFLYSSRPGPLHASSNHHYHAGSAPSGFPFEKQFGFYPDSPETSFMNPVTFGSMGIHREGNMMMNIGARAHINHGFALSGNMSENTSSSIRMMPSQRYGTAFFGSPYPGPASTGFENLIERARNRRVDNNVGQLDNKMQYHLDLDKIISGEDTRTTLMIKNIPNKYTSNMLLAAIDENHKGTYDFLYLPIDFKNKCNVGYAFINMVSPSHIISFYQAFNGKKWEKFNSEKVALLAYARIQGKSALITHFQNSSLMNEDKRCRPMLFPSEQSEAADQDHFLPNGINFSLHQQDGASETFLDSLAEKSIPTEKLENHGLSGNSGLVG